MGDANEILARQKLGPLVPEGNESQNVAVQANSGNWWQRLRDWLNPPPPDPPPPPKMPSPYDMIRPDGGEWKKNGIWNPGMAAAFDSTPLGVTTYRDRNNKLHRANVTLGNVPNILFNEFSADQGGDPQKSFAGDGKLRQAKSDIAHAIFNDLSYRPGTQVASPFISNKRKQQKDFQNFKEYQGIARNAFADRMDFKDPVEGRGNYNIMPPLKVGPRIVNGRPDPNQTIYRSYGPFWNAAKNREESIYIYNPSLIPSERKRKSR